MIAFEILVIVQLKTLVYTCVMLTSAAYLQACDYINVGKFRFEKKLKQLLTKCMLNCANVSIQGLCNSQITVVNIAPPPPFESTVLFCYDVLFFQLNL